MTTGMPVAMKVRKNCCWRSAHLATILLIKDEAAHHRHMSNRHAQTRQQNKRRTCK